MQAFHAREASTVTALTTWRPLHKSRDRLSVIGFHQEVYSLSAVVCRQSCIHPCDRISGCWFLLTFFTHSSPVSIDFFSENLLKNAFVIHLMRADFSFSVCSVLGIRPVDKRKHYDINCHHLLHDRHRSATWYVSILWLDAIWLLSTHHVLLKLWAEGKMLTISLCRALHFLVSHSGLIRQW